MKNYILILTLFIASLAYGQVVENQNLRLEYVTVAQGYLVLNAKSLAACGTGICFRRIHLPIPRR